MQYNCCSFNDMSKLDDMWQKYKSSTLLNQNYHIYFITELMKNHNLYKKTATQILNSPSTICQNAANSVLNLEINDEIIEKVKNFFDQAAHFDLKMK